MYELPTYDYEESLKESREAGVDFDPYWYEK